MKRNLLALLLALVMVTGCIFALSPAVFAETADTTTEDTTTGDTTTGDTTPGDTTTGDTTPEDTTPEDTTPEDTTPEDTTPEDTTPEAAEKPFPEPINSILLWIINFFKTLLAYLGL